MDTLVIVLCVVEVGLLFLMCRNYYVHARLLDALHAVHLYGQYLISMGQFDAALEIYDTMLMDYNDLLLSFYTWGRYVGIRPQYREIMKPYFDEVEADVIGELPE